MSTTEPYFLDDRVIIPEYIKKMTSEERKAEIARIEKEDREKRKSLTREKNWQQFSEKYKKIFTELLS